jgi:simple sugar transport system ATP-binding protein
VIDQQTIAVELRGITKRFPGVIANDDITLAVQRGEIHALVGENGAGKSTLMKILYGMQTADEGTMHVDGAEIRFKTPKEAIAAGIGMVHQHFKLAGNFTVWENVVLGSEPTSGPVIAVDEARERIRDIGENYGLAVDPDALVSELSVGEKQRVEIIKVLFRGARILILDEPTAVLVPHEVDELFDNLQELKQEGVTVIFISHKLDEVLAVADSITVIRAGRTIDTVAPADVTAHDLAELMVGSELPTPETEESTVTEDVLITVEDLGVDDPESGKARLDQVSFAVHSGEIVGVAGVEGNGQKELLQSIIGVTPPDRGRIEFLKDDLTSVPTRRRLDAGIGYIPEDRQAEGLLLSRPLWENAMLGHQRSEPYVRSGWLIDRRGSRRQTGEIVDRFDVRTVGVDVSAISLSGGNQQKLVVGREVAAEPKLLIAAQPTRGIDVGAQAAVWDELRAARRAGLGVLLISADLEELIGLSDTIYVIYGGRFVACLDPAEVTPKVLGGYMTGASEGAA